MSMARRFHGEPFERLIINVLASRVKEVDALISYRHAARGNRAEFIRLAIDEKYGRDVAERAAKPATALAVPANPFPDRTENLRQFHQRTADDIDSRLDELSDLCAHWSRNRRGRRTPPSVRAAILQCMQELAEDLGAEGDD